eukprot:Pgem_evm1s9687
MMYKVILSVSIAAMMAFAHPTSEKECCAAMTASCLSCKQKITEVQFCANEKNSEYCPSPEKGSKARRSEELIDCASNPENVECKSKDKLNLNDDEGSIQCCMAMTAKCLACAKR